MGHLKDVGETYWQHLVFATSVAFKLFIAAFALVIHAIFPQLFETTASDTIKEIYDLMKNRSPSDSDDSDDSNDSNDPDRGLFI